MASVTIPVEEFDLIIFGATGDLAMRKIIPGLFRRLQAGTFDENSRIIGVARTEYSTEEFHKDIRRALKKHVGKDDLAKDAVDRFLGIISYQAIDVFEDTGWPKLGKMLRADKIRAFYFSVGPSLFGQIARKLTEFELSSDKTRIVVEKPFGRDLQSAQELNKELRSCFEESQIYRIDHYLGKETVQNLMAVRFGNALFEPLWSSAHIDHVQITAAESLSVGDRGPYYNRSGAMRDMVQNHIMQLLCLTAMEPPSEFEADAVRDEKLKVIRALQQVPKEKIIRGQYEADADEPSYLEQVEDQNSTTECFVALKCEVANWRWAGVPFYLRTGKRLKARMTEIAIQFKTPPHSIFGKDTNVSGNLLRIRLQPDEGMTLSVVIKDPGPGGMRLREVPLDMSFAEVLGDEINDSPDAYERLIMDVIRGNQTLFMRGDEVEEAWKWVDPIIQGWEGQKPDTYEPGSEGPKRALRLLHEEGREWQEMS